MSSFKLSFDTGNAAFDNGDGASECARIVNDVAARIGRGQTEGAVFDVNGNRVGSWAMTLPEPDEDEDGDEG